MKIAKSLLALAILCHLAACELDTDPAISAIAPASTYAPAFDIKASLEAIAGLEVVERADMAPEGYRFFLLTYEQPVDHENPDGPWFDQRMALLHRSADAPMIFVPMGYELYAPHVEELTMLLSANQLSVEHRYFAASRPETLDWQHLDISQAAADHHRIVEAIKPVYSGAWISTGGSKGGMTALYHRRFYPDDVDATVAYVAPLSYGQEDPRYAAFLQHVGDAACRERVRAFQRNALLRRDRLVPIFEALAAQSGTGFTRVRGGADAALDIAVAEFSFYLWQYRHASDCQYLPGPDADDLDYVWRLAGTAYYATDLGMEYFLPYYYQASTQLGYPRLPTEHLQDLLHHDPNDYTLYTGSLPIPAFDHEAMIDLTFWALFEGESLLYIYGENDPWTAGAFPVPPWSYRRDVYRYTVAEGNHYAEIAHLTATEQSAVHALLEAWTGVAVDAGAATLPVQTRSAELPWRRDWRSQPPLRR